MDFHFHPSQSKNNHPTKPSKKRLTQDQVRLLEKSFNTSQKLQAERKLQLAHKLGLPPRQVAIWYQNRRARWKTQTIELDHKTIQLRLDNVLSHNKQLEREVSLLKQQLQKAQEVLLLPSNPSAIRPSPLSSPLEELYASLIDHESQPEKSSGHDFFAQSIIP